MNWIKILLSDSPEISSKRVVTLISILLIIGFVIASISGVKLDIQILWGLITLCSGSIGLTVVNDSMK